jgi:hypothetical protein
MNKEFETTNLMVKNKPLENLHIYYIDELNGHLYVADRKLTLGKFRKILENYPDRVIIQEDFGDFKKIFLGFKTKEAALEALTTIQRAII